MGTSTFRVVRKTLFVCLVFFIVFTQNSKADAFPGEFMASARTAFSVPQPVRNALTLNGKESTSQKAHDLVGAYYDVTNFPSARLMLNNKGPAPIEVRPTLFNMIGERFEPAPIIVPGRSFRFINLAEWANLGGESFKSGSIKLFHYGKDLVIGAQIYLEDEPNSLSFEEKLGELGKFDSRRQEAVWFQPSRDTVTKIIISNKSGENLDLRGRLSKAPRVSGATNNFSLGPFETKVLDILDDFSDGNRFVDTELIGAAFEHAGQTDGLQVRAMIMDRNRGYSNLVQFSNPAGGRSSEYQGVGFHIDEVDGQSVRTFIAARNVGETLATVRARIPYTRTDGTDGQIELPNVVLKPGEIKLFDQGRIAQRATKESIKLASLEITYDTAPGSVLVAAHSVGAGGSLVLRPPMWDPLAQKTPTGGYPWRIDETSSTRTYIKNITNRGQNYVAFLFTAEGEEYMIGEKTVEPFQTIEIDVKDLRDRQVADFRGRTIPQDVNSGQIHWLHMRTSDPLTGDEEERENLALVGRSEQVDSIKGISSNYACQSCCGGSSTGYVTDNPFGFYNSGGYEAEVGDVVQLYAFKAVYDCNIEGEPSPPPYVVPVYTTNWRTSNSAVASVSSNGLVTINDASETSVKIEPVFYVQIYYENPCPPGPELSSSCEMVKGDPEKSVVALAPGCGSCATLNHQVSPDADFAAIPRIVNITSTNASGNLQGTTQKAMLGATVPLKTTVVGTKPNGVYEWKIGDTVVGENSSNLNHAITSLGSHSLSLTYRIGTVKSRPKTVTLNVVVPQVSADSYFLVQAETDVLVGHGCFGFFDPRFYITTGCPETIHGAIFTAWINDPGSYISNKNESRVKLLQIVDQFVSRTSTTTGACEKITRRGTSELAWMLDSADPYGAPNNPALGNIQPTSGPNIATNDTPNMVLQNGYNFSIDNRFEMYIVYFTGTTEQPENEKAIGIVEWSYGGSTRFLSATNAHEAVPNTLFPTSDVRLVARRLTPTNQGTGIRQYDRTPAQTLTTWRACS